MIQTHSNTESERRYLTECIHTIIQTDRAGSSAIPAKIKFWQRQLLLFIIGDHEQAFNNAMNIAKIFNKRKHIDRWKKRIFDKSQLEKRNLHDILNKTRLGDLR